MAMMRRAKKAYRKGMSEARKLRKGMTKTVKGVTYKLGQSSRWERMQKGIMAGKKKAMGMMGMNKPVITEKMVTKVNLVPPAKGKMRTKGFAKAAAGTGGTLAVLGTISRMSRHPNMNVLGATGKSIMKGRAPKSIKAGAAIAGIGLATYAAEKYTKKLASRTKTFAQPWTRVKVRRYKSVSIK